MGIKLNETIEINRPVEIVFAYITDLKNDPKWQKGLADAEYTSPGPVDVGTTGVHRAKVMGLVIEVGWQISDYEESKHTAWNFVSGPFEGSESYLLEPTPNGTRFIHTADLHPKGPLNLLSPVVGGLFAKQSQANVEQLKEILESQG